MSKITKLIKNPVRFFADARKNKLLARSLAMHPPVTQAKKVTPVKKKPAIASSATKKAVNTAIKKKTDVARSVTKKAVDTASGILFGNIQLKDDIAIYFDGAKGNYYQIEQWFQPLAELSNSRKLVFILREKEIFNRIISETNFQAVHCHKIDDLMQVYEKSNFKCILYVNHAARNFQSLIHGKSLHIHINHGESDKLSTITNQSKSYDFVYLVGDAAYDKYNLNLMNKDISKYIKIGRPQIEHITRIKGPDESKLSFFDTEENTKILDLEDVNVDYPVKAPQDKYHEDTSDSQESTTPAVAKQRKVILYAPTWESTHESMNYSSLGKFGLTIVTQILAHSDYYLIYKPHPNTGSRDTKLSTVNKQIIALLSNNPKGEAILAGDINSLYEHVDLAVFDNSAVAIDYLAVNKPMLMSDLFEFDGHRQDKPIIVNAARMLKRNDISSLMPIIAEEISGDSRKRERQIVKKYFLGDFDYANKESTKRFIEEIDKACLLRDELILKLNEEVARHIPPI